MKQINQRKAISPIIATLLLILIAIAAGVVVYAYVIGFVGSNTSQAGSKTTLGFDQLNVAGGAALANNQVNAYVKDLGSSAEVYSISTGGLVSSYETPSGGTTQQLQLALLITVTSAWTKGASPGTLGLSIASANSFSLAYTCSSCNDVGTLSVNFMGQIVSITGGTASTQTLTIPGTLSSTSGALTLASTTVNTAAAGTKLNDLVSGFPSSLTLSQPTNSIQGFTLAPQSTGTAIVSGTQYTIQVVGNDGAQIVGSAKAV
jgi:archaeal type IV pilus assembly protein PilA